MSWQGRHRMAAPSNHWHCQRQTFQATTPATQRPSMSWQICLIEVSSIAYANLLVSQQRMTEAQHRNENPKKPSSVLINSHARKRSMDTKLRICVDGKSLSRSRRLAGKIQRAAQACQALLDCNCARSGEGSCHMCLGGNAHTSLSHSQPMWAHQKPS